MNVMRRWKRTICTAVAVMAGSMCLAASPADIYKEAAETMAAHPDGEYVIRINMQMPMIGAADIVNTVDLQAEPFIVNSKTTITGLGKTTEPTQAYVEQDGDKLNVYYGKTSNGKTEWRKTSQKLNSTTPISQEFNANHDVLAGVKSIAAAGDNAYTVVYDAKKLYQDTDKANLKKAGCTPEQIDMITQVLQSLQQSGDISAVVTVDPVSNRISRVRVSLTPQMRSIAMSLLDQYQTTEANKAIVKQFIQFSEIDMTVDCTALPEGTALTVPQSIKKQAVSVKEKAKR
ncbi:hypothetical protein AB840_11540 [Megasphaera cerevisiae DSM 20462]|jgi:hypothetical protein|uniref:Uncharacterized protein n=1 Tax=Megasphaera cerevisiae DSM 20462 TaxID=1122219 RepID=A0A0J6WUE2_9FIRM|nr:hypothetical protein [Megasphaera cerevisiae]KMO85803.1 hypothetical protein AB840_11540 [Megasphaera cerevisiae DSM 20462]OKY52963.1 hypothetical protein BSR42_10100 [Megasphaera cerevisiae]SJZ70965.1 hypothetical protein SAMN05660900_01248 [Megasphaera cerevisiae DSM 20462]